MLKIKCLREVPRLLVPGSPVHRDRRLDQIQMTSAEDALCGLRQGGLRLERYVEEFLEISNRMSWHEAALGACFLLGLDDEIIRCDLPVSDFPLIELINLILFLNGSDDEVEEIPLPRHPTPAGTRRVSPAHPTPRTSAYLSNGSYRLPNHKDPPCLRSSFILLSPEPPSSAKPSPRAVALSSPVPALPERPQVTALPKRPQESAPRQRPPVPAPRQRPPVAAPSQHPPVAAPRKLLPVSPLVPSSSALPERPREFALPERPREFALPERPREFALPERPRDTALPERPRELVPSSSPSSPLVPSSSPSSPLLSPCRSVQLSSAPAGSVRLPRAPAGSVRLPRAPAGSVRLPRAPSDHASSEPPRDEEFP